MTEHEKSTFQTLRFDSYLFSGNDAYLESLYEQYLHDPTQLAAEWKHYFDQVTDPQDVSHADIRDFFLKLAKQTRSVAMPSAAMNTAEVRTLKAQILIQSYRRYGHYQANLDPLGLAPKRPIAALLPESVGLTLAEQQEPIQLNGLLGLNQTSVPTLLETLKKIYCASLGFETQHLSDEVAREWLQQQIEANAGALRYTATEKKRILQGLIRGEGLEKYLGSKFVAQKRFSLEGGDSLIPLLDNLVARAKPEGVEEIVIGMAHRGRLNVLINILGKLPSKLFEEFEGKLTEENRSGDVKYHKGFATDMQTEAGILHIAMAFNPSHLEIVNPVVEGSVRSRQERRGDDTGKQVLPVLIHGDAAFSGQGIVMETLELSQTQGYSTGGTLHIIVNNQIGFTTDPQNSRSSWYCSDPAKMIEAPIFHVNGDDPEAVLFALQTALTFRQRFRRDVVIDLVCYRRHGHNEADEPSATQPLVYQAIKKRATVRDQYAQKLITEAVLTEAEVHQAMEDYRSQLASGKPVVSRLSVQEYNNPYRIDWHFYQNQSWNQAVPTGVALEPLKKLAKTLETLPAAFTLQPQVAKIIEDRRKMTSGQLPLNWGYAENLAYATLLQENFGVRISGQDCGRGTFFHRHAVLHDHKTGEIFVPLAQLAQPDQTFAVIDSTLSEAGVMGFEYGYASANPKSLVIWEAQYGDFVNGAQVVIDQFLSSSEQKMGTVVWFSIIITSWIRRGGP
ncbi:2-oxoglutarate dehydrogenase E1 component [Diplorickettsia massiliensis]